jgi:hypothetical protein
VWPRRFPSSSQPSRSTPLPLGSRTTPFAYWTPTRCVVRPSRIPTNRDRTRCQSRPSRTLIRTRSDVAPTRTNRSATARRGLSHPSTSWDLPTRTELRTPVEPFNTPETRLRTPPTPPYPPHDRTAHAVSPENACCFTSPRATDRHIANALQRTANTSSLPAAPSNGLLRTGHHPMTVMMRLGFDLIRPEDAPPSRRQRTINREVTPAFEQTATWCQATSNNRRSTPTLSAAISTAANATPITRRRTPNELASLVASICNPIPTHMTKGQARTLNALYAVDVFLEFFAAAFPARQPTRLDSGSPARWQSSSGMWTRRRPHPSCRKASPRRRRPR